MKKRFLVLAAVSTVIVTVVAVSCKRNIDQNKFAPRATAAGHLDGAAGLPTANVPNTVDGPVTLDNGHLWILDGKCYVKPNGVLTIDPGTYVAAVKHDNRDSASAIVVTRGGKIDAVGADDAPIVFTSAAECPASGDWGGVVLLGRAPLNRADTTIEGINKPSLPAGVDVDYGGGGACQGDSLDNSGTLKYVRIEYAGTIISPDNELNGLTCGGVGAGTTLSNIEVAYGNDDAFEFFGGTVNCDHLIALAPDDDAFDFDFGFTGSLQFCVSILKPGLDYSANPNGIESDNNATGDANTCKRTRPVISNMTVIGMCDSIDAVTTPTAGLLNGAFFRRASANYVHNSVFIGFPTGVNFSSTQSIDSAVNFQYNTVQAFSTVSVPATAFQSTNRGIRSRIANDPLINLMNPCDACNPDFRPIRNLADPSLSSTLLTDPVNFAGMTSFIQPVTYRGAVNAGNGLDALWPMQLWVKYDYEPYCIGCGQ